MSDTVLFVDDETEIRNSMKRLLRKEPYDLLFASSADEAIETIKQKRINLVITDQKMPGTTGVELLGKIKKQWPETIRLLISGYIETDLLITAINQGEIFRFLTKPWDNEELKRFIKEGLHHYEVIQENTKFMSELIETGFFLNTANNERGSVINWDQDVINNLEYGLLVMDNNLNILRFNEKGAALCGKPSLESGLNITDVFETEIAEFIKRAVNEPDGQDSGEFKMNGKKIIIRTRSFRNEDSEKGLIFING